MGMEEAPNASGLIEEPRARGTLKECTNARDFNTRRLLDRWPESLDEPVAFL